MKTMVIIAHPDLNHSRVNRTFAQALQGRENIVVRNLYEQYPDWHMDAAEEQRLLLQYDRIVFQFPFYWYSCPPLLKKWFDDVLTFGWAFGPGGDHLKGKQFMVATTAGGTDKAYRSGGDNGFTISELLRPIQATLIKCGGIYLPAFITYDANQGSEEYIAREAAKYAEHIQASAGALAH